MAGLCRPSTRRRHKFLGPSNFRQLKLRTGYGVLVDGRVIPAMMGKEGLKPNHI
jgi:hypothetical protein